MSEFVQNTSVHHYWTKEYGKVFKVGGLLGESQLFIVDPKAINHIITHSVDYQKPADARKATKRIFGGDGIIFAEGDTHRYQRRLLNPSFGPSAIKELVPIFFEKALQLREILSNDISTHEYSPKKVDILPWLSRTTLDVIGLAGFNYQFEALNIEKGPNPLNKALSTIFNADGSLGFFRILQAMIPILTYIPTKRGKVELLAKETMLGIAEELVKKRKDVLSGSSKTSGGDEVIRDAGPDLLTTLVAANMDAETSEAQRMSHEELISQIPTLFIAGHETTSTQTTWALYLLCQRKDIQERLYHEVASVPTETPSADELFDLPFLDSVVRETMRIQSAISASSRVAMRDDLIPVSEPFKDKYGIVHTEIRIRKGEAIILSIHALNCLTDIWGNDALDFNPDRWLKVPDAARDIPGIWGNIMTFLGGSRGCIGYRFALYEMKVLLFTLIRSFTFELAVPADKIEGRVFGVTRPYVKGDNTSGSQLPVILRSRMAKA